MKRYTIHKGNIKKSKLSLNIKNINIFLKTSVLLSNQLITFPTQESQWMETRHPIMWQWKPCSTGVFLCQEKWFQNFPGYYTSLLCGEGRSCEKHSNALWARFPKLPWDSCIRKFNLAAVERLRVFLLPPPFHKKCKMHSCLSELNLAASAHASLSRRQVASQSPQLQEETGVV